MIQETLCKNGAPELAKEPVQSNLEMTPKVDRKPPRAPLTEKQQALATRYLPFARSLAKPFKATWAYESDEFESAACMGLVEAAQSYDASKNVKFSTFAAKRILGELRDVQRALGLSGFNGDPENAPQVIRYHPDLEMCGRVLGSRPEPPVAEEIDALDTVEYLANKLPRSHAAVCWVIYARRQTRREATKLLGLSRTRVNFVHQQSMGMLNEACRWKSLTHDEDGLLKPRPAPIKPIDPDGPGLPDFTIPERSPAATAETDNQGALSCSS